MRIGFAFVVDFGGVDVEVAGVEGRVVGVPVKEAKICPS